MAAGQTKFLDLFCTRKTIFSIVVVSSIMVVEVWAGQHMGFKKVNSISYLILIMIILSV